MMLSVKRVVAAVSGGVDSAVAALMLKRLGADVTGVFMKDGEGDDGEAAETVCRQIGIPFRDVSVREEYRTRVIAHVVESCQRRLTPEPDIVANQAIRMGWFQRYAADEMGADAVATGHYARTLRSGADVALLRGVDPVADQSLALSQVPQENLRRVVFPLGDLTRDSVVKIAEENELSGLTRRRTSLQRIIEGAKTTMRLVDVMTEQDVGEATIHPWAVGDPVDGSRYLVGRYESSCLVATNRDHPLLYSRMFTAEPPHWIRPGTDPEPILECEVKCCRLRRAVRGRVVQVRSGDVVVLMERDVRGMHPGQFVAFYSGDECLGGARLKILGPSCYSLKNALPEEKHEYNVYESYPS